MASMITTDFCPVQGCLLRLHRPGECRSYFAEPQFPSQKDAKAAVSLLALSQGAGNYIRKLGAVVESRVSPQMRQFVLTLVFPALAAETHRISGVPPHFEFSATDDGEHQRIVFRSFVDHSKRMAANYKSASTRRGMSSDSTRCQRSIDRKPTRRSPSLTLPPNRVSSTSCVSRASPYPLATARHSPSSTAYPKSFRSQRRRRRSGTQTGTCRRARLRKSRKRRLLRTQMDRSRSRNTSPPSHPVRRCFHKSRWAVELSVVNPLGRLTILIDPGLHSMVLMRGHLNGRRTSTNRRSIRAYTDLPVSRMVKCSLMRSKRG